MTCGIYIRREANDAEKKALRELREDPTRYRWCITGREGFTVTAMHDALPYVTLPIATATRYYIDIPQSSRKVVARAIVAEHNAALDRAKEGVYHA